VTDTSCRTQDVGMSTRYWCTLTYSDWRIKQPTTDGPALARPLAQRGRNALPDCLTGCLKSNYTSIACSFNRSAICGRSWPWWASSRVIGILSEERPGCLSVLLWIAGHKRTNCFAVLGQNSSKRSRRALLKTSCKTGVLFTGHFIDQR
jgi:hypothetical protein